VAGIFRLFSIVTIMLAYSARAVNHRGKIPKSCYKSHNPENAIMARQSGTLSAALAHHWLVGMRGGEKMLAVLAEQFPQAPIYTLIARHDQLDPHLSNHPIKTSWLQKWSWIPDLQRKALPLLFAAAGSLDASQHDVVLCSDAAGIKAIRTRPDALKLCYCHSPIRYVWDLYDQYYANAGLAGRLGLRAFAKKVRDKDRLAADSVTAFMANSRHVAERIKRCYDRNSVVIPPPVDTDFPQNNNPPENYYLIVSEHVSYKRNDLAIDACTQLNKPLVVIGTGPLLKSMRQRAGSSVRFLGWQSDDVVRSHLQHCRALLFCGQEDFGMVPVEAQAAGRPVIAYAAGGALETVKDNQTGIYFKEQTVDSVTDAIQRFESTDNLYTPQLIQEHAAQFSTQKFIDRFNRFYHWCLAHYQMGGADQVRQAMIKIDREAFL